MLSERAALVVFDIKRASKIDLASGRSSTATVSLARSLMPFKFPFHPVAADQNPGSDERFF